MSQFYQEIITEKSWKTLMLFKKQFDFILIGGWAVYLYTNALKSKDIDIVVDYPVLGKLKAEYDIIKNDRLKKYEMKREEVDVDIYLPHFSFLGLPAEGLMRFTTKKETFTLPCKETLLITKQNAYLSRRSTVKGQKDKIDIIALLMLPDFNFNLYRKILNDYKLTQYSVSLTMMLDETHEIKELGLNRHYFSQKKKRIKDGLTQHSRI